MSERTLTAADGGRLAYRVDGEDLPWGTPRPVILMQHGLGFRAQAWAEWLPTLLGAGYRVIRPDMRGHGASAPAAPDYAWSTEGLLDDIEAILAAEGVGPVILLGESWGGTLMLAMAARLGERARALATVSTAYDGRQITAAQHFAKTIRTAGKAAWSKPLAETRFPRSGDAALAAWADASQMASDTDSLCGFIDYLLGSTVEPCLPKIVCPTLLMSSSGSPFVRPAMAKDLASRIADVELAWFPGHGHGLVLSGAEAGAQTLVAFLHRHLAGG